MYTTEDKYLPLAIEVEERPTIIVGMNPGKTRNGKYSPYVWDGDTPTSNLLREAVEPYTNIVLANVCNYQTLTEENMEQGIEDLKQMIEDLEPKKIICLGSYAQEGINKINPICEVVKLNHPSYIVRFNKDKQDYITKIRKELE